MKSVILSFLALCFAVSPTFAASSSWLKTEGAKIRLISMPSADGESLQAGLQVELEKGWKTYWKAPGASGLPPQLDFSASKNVVKTRMHFPVPIAFGSSRNLTAGYDTSITFPIDVEPLFANRPVVLKATGLIGLCADICVPFQFELGLTEDGKGQSKRDIARALLSSRSSLMSQSTERQNLSEVWFDDRDSKKLIIKARVPQDTQNGLLLVEGPSNWYLTPARASTISGDTARFEIDLSQMPKGTDPTTENLRFSLVADGVGVWQDMMPQRRAK